MREKLQRESDRAMQGFPRGERVVIGADLSGGEEVTGRSGIQVSNTEGGIVANRVK